MKQTISIGRFNKKKKMAGYAPAIRALSEKKALNLVAVDISGYSVYADYIIICTATSARHAQTLAEAVRDKQYRFPKSMITVEGFNPGDWILLDLGGIVIHIFSESLREEYDIEGLWSESTLYSLVDRENNDGQ